LGSSFTIMLPLSAHVPKPADDTPQTMGALTGVRVLVVDDEPDARELLYHVLTGRGADVSTAGSAGEAMAALVGRAYDLLLADLGMPVEDGFSLITAIRNHQKPDVRAVRAIAVTAYTSDHAHRRAISAGYDGYFTKPFDFDRLLNYLTSNSRT